MSKPERTKKGSMTSLTVLELIPRIDASTFRRQASRPQQLQVLLLLAGQPPAVDTVQMTGTLDMGKADDVLALATSHTPRTLQNSQSDSGTPRPRQAISGKAASSSFQPNARLR